VDSCSSKGYAVSKKQQQPLPPYFLQVLTTQYLIEGTVAGDTFLHFPALDTIGPPLLCVASAQLQATGATDLANRACARFMVMGANAVALVPGVDMGQLPQADTWRIPKVPVRGVFCFGPYVVQGTLVLSGEGRINITMPMYDLRIASYVPGSRWDGLQAPFGLVNGRWLQGYEPQ